MADYLTMDGYYNPSFDLSFAIHKFDADSGNFDLDYADLSANPKNFREASVTLYPNLEHASNTNVFLHESIFSANNTFPDLKTIPGYRASKIPLEETAETCRLSSVAPALDNSHQPTSLLHPPSVAVCPCLENHPRRPSECSSVWSDSSYSTSSRLSADSTNVPGSNAASQADGVKPRKKRGRKRANISDEERRSRKLERGRVAANKCRQKKRVRENELESKALLLVADRDRMLQINHDLRDEVIGLQTQILEHVGRECGGIPNAEQIISSIRIPPQRLEEVERGQEDQLKHLLEKQTHRSDSTPVNIALS